MEKPRYDVFVSYNRRDKDEVERLAHELRRANIEVFIDKSLEPGVEWLEVLEEALATSSACAVCFGADGLGDWTRVEVDIAIKRATTTRDGSFRLIPVLLPGSDISTIRPILQKYHAVDLTAGVTSSPELRQLVSVLKSNRAPSEANGDNRHTSVRHAREIPITHLSQNLTNLRHHIKDRTFTPILGSGCSLVARSHSPAWSSIAEDMEHILRMLADDDRASQYLRNLAAVQAYAVPVFAHRSPIAPSHVAPSLMKFQAEMSRLGAMFNQLFATVMLEAGLAVWDTVTYAVPIPDNHPLLYPASEQLLTVCLAAHEARAELRTHDATSGLGIVGLYDHLIDIAAELADEKSLTDLNAKALAGTETVHADSYTDVWEDITSARDTQRWTEARSEHLKLAIHQLEWIADALWHTFRYDKPAYPRSDELAFQVSLLGRRTQGRGPGLPTVAQTAEVEPETVAGWLRRYSANSAPRMLEFYDMLATILKLEYKTFKAHASGDTSDSLKLLWPVAFSTNYDLEMEEAFYRTEGISHFHVVIPVYGFRSDAEDPELGWLLGRVRNRHDDVDEPAWEWFPRTKHLRVQQIHGPILIKLHGSPLHKLPDPSTEDDDADDMPSYERFEHALTLTESQYLEGIAWKDPLPDFFNVVLHQDRALYFLGHSVKEWSTRLRVFNHVYRRGEPPKAHPSRVAINRNHDPHRSALLSAIGIERWVGELEDVSKAVSAMMF